MLGHTVHEAILYYLPIDRDIASTPATRWPCQLTTCPPAASILARSSSLSGWTSKKHTTIRHTVSPSLKCCITT